jgi:hypothetical protein
MIMLVIARKQNFIKLCRVLYQIFTNGRYDKGNPKSLHPALNAEREGEKQ